LGWGRGSRRCSKWRRVDLYVHEPHQVTIETLEHTLADAFESLRETIKSDQGVVISLDDAAVQGVADVADSALAHALLGLARAMAIEGREAGWHVTVLSSSADTPEAERLRWLRQLSEPGTVNGSFVRLGGSHLGTVPA